MRIACLEEEDDAFLGQHYMHYFVNFRSLLLLRVCLSHECSVHALEGNESGLGTADAGAERTQYPAMWSFLERIRQI